MNTLIFGDKNVAEILPFSVEFSDRLLVGEHIFSVQVDVLVFSGVDLTPQDMITDAPVPPAVNTAGDGITFTLTGGVAGVIYQIVVSALIDSENLYIKVGHLAVVASDPFASNAFSPFTP